MQLPFALILALSLAVVIGAETTRNHMNIRSTRHQAQDTPNQHQLRREVRQIHNDGMSVPPARDMNQQNIIEMDEQGHSEQPQEKQGSISGKPHGTQEERKDIVVTSKGLNQQNVIEINKPSHSEPPEEKKEPKNMTRIGEMNPH